MAQNEIQKYTNNNDFYNSTRNPLETWRNNYDALRKLSDFLNTATAADYPDIPSATLTAVGGLRTQINTYLASDEVADMLAEVKKFTRI
ncbi:MAG: hypothetical protein B6I36_09875 [Desulfobacteraceae bacterium 4572_35.1]|nr:MAG: hypothetical protein B6I36_09875 [Desulfobacteraceae bacterium 4572_35.1]